MFTQYWNVERLEALFVSSNVGLFQSQLTERATKTWNIGALEILGVVRRTEVQKHKFTGVWQNFDRRFPKPRADMFKNKNSPIVWATARNEKLSV